MIFTRINDQLFSPADDKNKEQAEEDNDTDYDSDDSCFIKKTNASLTIEDIDKYKETDLNKFRCMITSKLSEAFANVNPDKYINGIKEEIKKKVDQDIPLEFQDPTNIFKHTIDTMCDYLETSYWQSIFVESIDMSYILYMNQFSASFEADFGQQEPVFMAKIIPLVFRMREYFKDQNIVLQGLEENKKTEEEAKNEKKIEEPKVVELTEEDLHPSKFNNQGSHEIEDNKSSQIIEETKEFSADNQEWEQSDQWNNIETKLEDLRQSIKLFAKLILTEGIENSPDIDVPFGFGGDDMGELGPILQSIMG